MALWQRLEYRDSLILECYMRSITPNMKSLFCHRKLSSRFTAVLRTSTGIYLFIDLSGQHEDGSLEGSTAHMIRTSHVCHRDVCIALSTWHPDFSVCTAYFPKCKRSVESTSAPMMQGKSQALLHNFNVSAKKRGPPPFLIPHWVLNSILAGTGEADECRGEVV